MSAGFLFPTSGYLQTMSTKVIKLEALVKPTPLIIEVDGVRHPLVPATVETYIENMRDIEALSLNASPTDELELAVKLIVRAFPTLTNKQVRGWTVEVIHQLAQIARGADGQVVTDENEAPVTEGNALPA
jgi:hypothetical protein